MRSRLKIISDLQPKPGIVAGTTESKSTKKMREEKRRQRQGKNRGNTKRELASSVVAELQFHRTLVLLGQL